MKKILFYKSCFILFLAKIPRGYTRTFMEKFFKRKFKLKNLIHKIPCGTSGISMKWKYNKKKKIQKSLRFYRWKFKEFFWTRNYVNSLSELFSRVCKFEMLFKKLNFIYSASIDFVSLPLPPRYRFRLNVTHRYRF